MRASEWIQIAFAIGIGLLAWMRPLEMRRRLRIALLAVIVPAAILWRDLRFTDSRAP